MPVAAELAKGLAQHLDLRRGQVFAVAPIELRLTPRGDSAERAGGDSRPEGFVLRGLGTSFQLRSAGLMGKIVTFSPSPPTQTGRSALLEAAIQNDISCHSET
jgi:hypothetical protein